MTFTVWSKTMGVFGCSLKTNNACYCQVFFLLCLFIDSSVNFFPPPLNCKSTKTGTLLVLIILSTCIPSTGPSTQLDFNFFFFSAKLNSHWCRWPLFIIAGLCFAGSCCISGFLGSPIHSPPLPCLGLSLVTGSKVLSVALVPTIVSVPACSRLPPSPVIFYHHTVDSWRAGTLLDTS